jgi:hypothetical protein
LVLFENAAYNDEHFFISFRLSVLWKTAWITDFCHMT